MGDIDFDHNYTAEEVKKKIEEIYLTNAYACFEGGDYPRCDDVAHYHETSFKNIHSAKAIYKKNCDDHDLASSCFHFGRTQFKTMKTREDYVLAHQYFEKACRLGDKKSCYESGRMLLDKYHPKRKDPYTGAKALEYFERGCSNGMFEKTCCHAASEFHRVGLMGTPIDKAQALKYAELCCEHGGDMGCINAYLMHKNGDGVPVNEEKAIECLDSSIKNSIGDLKFIRYVSEGYRRMVKEQDKITKQMKKEKKKEYNWMS